MMKFVVVLAAAAAASVAATASRPNIIWIMADDLGYGEVGAYPCDSPHGRIATPNLDKFAAEGMRFTDAYAGYTVCAPSRTTFFTGRHSGQFKKYGLPGTSLSANNTATKTLSPTLLQEAGYTTAAFGKVAPLDSPVDQGFGTFLGQVNQAYCHNMYPHAVDSGREQLNVNLTLNWKEKNRNLTMANPDAFNYTVDITHTSGKEWLDAYVSQQSDKPFFLYLAYTVPHAGGWGTAPEAPEQGAPVPTDGQYTNHSWPDVERDHASVITYLDNYVGGLMGQLQELGIDEDTIVFFASDNGAHLEGGHNYHFFNSTGGLLGHKRSLFEGGMRSPSMVRWPSVVPNNVISTHQWAFWDALPTFMDLAGRPDLTPTDIDGISFYPTLTGSGTQANHSYLYWTWDGTGVPPLEIDAYGREIGKTKQTSGYAVRVDNWKGVVPHCADTSTSTPSKDDPLQLYDLSMDPFETTDIASKHPDVVASMLTAVINADISCDCYQC